MTDIDVKTVYIEDSIMEHNIKVTNEGEKYFWILDVANSCDCTSAEYPRQEVKNGETITIKLKLKLHKFDVGPFQRDVDVYTNLSNKPYTINIHGEAKHK